MRGSKTIQNILTFSANSTNLTVNTCHELYSAKHQLNKKCGWRGQCEAGEDCIHGQCYVMCDRTDSDNCSALEADENETMSCISLSPDIMQSGYCVTDNHVCAHVEKTFTIVQKTCLWFIKEQIITFLNIGLPGSNIVMLAIKRHPYFRTTDFSGENCSFIKI